MRNKLLLCVLLTGLMAVLLSGCDPVAEDDRYIEVERTLGGRVVLLEEFTGQNCSNCPTAHRTIEALQEQYGASLVSVSIHAGSFAYDEERSRRSRLLRVRPMPLVGA